MNRKLRVLSFILCLAFSMPFFSAFAANEGISVYLQKFEKKFTSDFTNHVSGNPDGFGGADNNGSRIGEVVDSTRGTSLVIRKNAYIDRSIQYNKCRTEFDLYLNDLSSIFTVVTRISGSNQPTIINLDTAGNGALRIRNAANSIQGTIWLDAQKWYRMRLDLDIGEHAFQVSVFNPDGSLKGTIDSSLNAECAAASNLRIFGNDAMTASSFVAVDNYATGEITNTDFTDGDRVNAADLTDGMLFAQTADAALYDNGILYATADDHKFDLSGLPFGKHQLESGGDRMNLIVYGKADVNRETYRFDGYETDKPAGFGGDENLGFYRGGTVDDAHGTSVLMGIDDTYAGKAEEGKTGGAFIDHPIGAAVCRVGFDLYLDSLDSTFSIRLRESGSLQPTIMNLDSSDRTKLRIRNAADSIEDTVFGIAAKTWYRIQMDIDTGNNAFTATVFNADGSQKGAVNSTLPSGLSKNTTFRICGPSNETPFTMAIDNFIISETVEFPLISSIGTENNTILSGDASFEVALTGPVDPLSVSPDKIQLMSGAERIAVSAVELSANNDVITVTPAKQPAFNEQYQLTIDRTVKTAGGYLLGRPLVGCFTVLPREGVNASLGDLKDSDGIVLSEIVPGGTAEISAEVFNNGSGGKNPVLILALYDAQGGLSVVNCEEAVLNAGESKSLSAQLTVPEEFTDGKIKVMVWSGFGEMAPACDVFEFKGRTVTTPVSIYLVGDSICQKYEADYYPQQGYGEYIGKYFTQGVTVENRGAGGRSTKSFIEEGKWDEILNSIQPSDYVFVCMGHNDMSTDPNRATTVAQYQEYLRQYVEDARGKKANVIFITPITKATNADNSLLERSNAMKAVALEKGVLLLDVNSVTYEHFISMGYETARDTYFLSKSYVEEVLTQEQINSHPNTNISGSAHQDLVHVNEAGADYIAKTIAALLKERSDPLKTLLK